MCRESVARQALRYLPLIQTRRADAARIERIPDMPAIAHPAVAFAGLPPAKRAADARAGTFNAPFVADIGFNVGISNDWGHRRPDHVMKIARCHDPRALTVQVLFTG